MRRPWQLFRVMDFVGPTTTDVERDVYQIMAGVEGSFSQRDWTWEAYVSSGQTERERLVLEHPVVAALLEPHCRRPERFHAARCARQRHLGPRHVHAGPQLRSDLHERLADLREQLDLGPGRVSADCLESIAANARSLNELDQDIAEFNLQGKIADMRSGELRFAVGASHRKNEFAFEPGETNDRESVNEQPMSIFASNDTAGQTKVQELYGELLVPVTSKFDLEFGARMSDYPDSEVGTTDTAKALFTFRATDGLTLRGGYQKAERAANTAELFQGVSLLVVPFGPSDPCSFTFDNNHLRPGQTWGNTANNPNRLGNASSCAPRSSTTAT